MISYIQPKTYINDTISNDLLTEKQANEIFLRKQAQGTETFKNVVINGTTNIENQLKVNTLDANTVLITDSSYNLASSTITSGELNNLLGCNSNIQDQLDDKSIVVNSDNIGTTISKPIILMGVVNVGATVVTVSFFDSNLFTTPPIVLGIVARDIDEQNTPNIGNITTSGFQCRLRGSAGTGSIRWVAIGN
jgi:hypothetical protein